VRIDKNRSATAAHMSIKVPFSLRLLIAGCNLARAGEWPEASIVVGWVNYLSIRCQTFARSARLSVRERMVAPAGIVLAVATSPTRSSGFYDPNLCARRCWASCCGAHLRTAPLRNPRRLGVK